MIKQIGKFGVIGLAATLCYAILFLLIHNQWQLDEQISNLIAFCAAFVLSWTGHYFWTFQSGGRQSIIRFFVVAVLGYGLNAFFVWLVITHYGLPDFYVLPFMLGVTPFFSFFLSSKWAFR